MTDDYYRPWVSTSETLSAVLIPLPFVLLSLIITFQMPLLPSIRELRASEPPTSDHESYEIHHSIPSVINSAVPIACALTSFTLLLVGIIGKLGGQADRLDGKGQSLGYGHEEEKTQTGLGMKALIQRLGRRILGVGLPFFAATQLGGERVAMVILAAISGNLETVNGQSGDFTSLEGWKRFLTRQKWMLAAFLLQWASDFAGLTSAIGPMTTISGYLALGLSAFFLPPPYPTSKPRASSVTSPISKSANKTSAIATPWEMPASVPTISPRLIKQSPMICTSRDTNLTIAAGVVTTVTSSLVFLTSSTSPVLSFINLSWMFLVIVTAMIALTRVDPDSLRTGRHLGLAVGLIISVVVQEIIHSPAFFSFACQGVLAGFFWQASLLDTQTPSLHYSHKGHHHHHDPHHPHHHHETHSMFTRMLLRNTQKWPLLNSILADKDSRRIFYFMRCTTFFFIVFVKFQLTFLKS